MMRCGLHRTSRDLVVASQQIVAPHLVYLHVHDDRAPYLLLPRQNRHNRWSFAPAELTLGPGDLDALQPLRPEGFYRTTEHFHPDEQRVVAKDALVQLGYNMHGEPIVFFPAVGGEDNVLRFPDRGMRISPEIAERLSPLDVLGPHAPQSVH